MICVKYEWVQIGMNRMPKDPEKASLTNLLFIISNLWKPFCPKYDILPHSKTMLQIIVLDKIR